jgi:photosystem II S4 domain protein
MLPRDALLAGSSDPEALAMVIECGEKALRTWEPVWTEFVAASLREEVIEKLATLSELRLGTAGGVPRAERCRLQLRRAELDATEADTEAPLTGLEMSGNFLFDPADPADFRSALFEAGARDSQLGDLWVRGERGAQLVVSPELAARLGGAQARVRSVEVDLEEIPLERLQPPARPLPRRFTAVEASRRLDAVASAGFGVSRSRMVALIRSGAVRINWRPMSSPSRELNVGDRVQLEGRGELTLLDVQPTKRDRWRLSLERT